MRTPGRHRSAPRQIQPPRRDVDMTLVANRSFYVGSPEHKDTPSFLGQPRPRADATICDPRFAERQNELTAHLREAMTRGCVGHPWEGGPPSYPRYVWTVIDGNVYEGRLVNLGNGGYKGYMLLPDEWPEGIEMFFDVS